MVGLLGVKFHDEQIEKTISVILRLPGLFLLDHWYQSSSTEIWAEVVDSPHLISSVVSPIIVVHSLLLLLLPLEDLVTLYRHYLSAALIAGSVLISHHYVRADDLSTHFFSFPIFGDIRTSSAPVSLHFVAIATQIIMATVTSFLLDVDCTLKKLILAVYTIPVAAKLAHFPLHYLETLHIFSSTLTLLSIAYYSLISLPRLLLYVHKRYKLAAHAVVQQGPINAAFGAWEWSFLMTHFLFFWCVLISAQLYSFWYQKNPPPGHLVVSPTKRGQWYIVVLYALSEACTSPISLVGCCIAVSYASWLILNLTKVFIQGTRVLLLDQALDKTGVTEGVMMALLALQTGLIDLPMPQRMGAMCIILFIVVISLVQSMHEIVEPILLTLSASHSRSILRHIRVIAVCLFLLVSSLYMTFVVCQLFEVDLWMLVVITTCTLTSVQVLGALIVYGLFLYDALQKDTGWEALDDIVYFTRAVIHVMEFLVSVLVVGSGVCGSMLLSSEGHTWSWLNGSVLAVHCYYNVYLRLQSGWQSFLLRREAARKILSLPSANPDQLESNSHDVCAICYMQMKTACVTPCSHLFHASCLKKWLYVQDRCPLCSLKITSKESNENKVPVTDTLQSPKVANSDASLPVNTAPGEEVIPSNNAVPTNADSSSSLRCQGSEVSSSSLRCQGSEVSSSSLRCQGSEVSSSSLRCQGSEVSSSSLRCQGSEVSSSSLRCQGSEVSSTSLRCQGSEVSSTSLRCQGSEVSSTSLRCQGSAVSSTSLRCQGSEVSSSSLRCQGSEVSSSSLRCQGSEVSSVGTCDNLKQSISSLHNS